MGKKERYLKLIVIISAVVIISVICTVIITIKMVSNKSDSVETSSTFLLEDRLYDQANIISCSDGMIIYKWNGQWYECPGVLEREYTGTADIEVKNHKIVCVKVKGKKNKTVAQKNVGVVIKNGSNIFYKSLWIQGNSELLVNGKSYGKNKINIGKYISKHKLKKVDVSLKSGKLFFGSTKDNVRQQGYEGFFTIYKKKKGYVLVNRIDIEDYIRYVIPSEMPVYFSKEALKAQAVCARTFAYVQMKNKSYKEYNADLDDSTSFQVYNSNGNHAATDEAVRETAGQVVSCNGELIECYYFSTSPGKTENMEVWKSTTPNYIHKVTSRDKNSQFYAWCAELNFKRYYDPKYGKLKKIEIKQVSDAGYVTKLLATYETQTVYYEKENDIRTVLGEYLEAVTLQDGTVREDLSKIPSAYFQIVYEEGDYCTLKGGGFGHGIGMSQYGAEMMAQNGKNYKSIIKYYYNNVQVSNISNWQ